MFRNLDAEQARHAMTNEDMATLLKVSRATYESKKKSGRFTVPEIKSMCALFSCGFDYLFETKED